VSYASTSRSEGPWWREPTKDNWYAFIAAWLGWTLDAFDFTVFLFLVVPIAKEFKADLTLLADHVDASWTGGGALRRRFDPRRRGDRHSSIALPISDDEGQKPPRRPSCST
jgi:hypothetical protein